MITSGDEETIADHSKGNPELENNEFDKIGSTEKWLHMIQNLIDMIGEENHLIL